MSKHLSDILKFKDATHSFQNLIKTIDRVHRFPSIPDVPVIRSRSRTEQGSYVGLFRPNVPVRISVSIHAKFPELTLSHELGHLLDHMAFNPIKQGYGSEMDPMFDALRALWRKSETIRLLERLATSRRNVASASDRRFLYYQLLPREIWARTYVQWICTRSGDDFLLGLLAASRQAVATFAGARCSFHWAEEEFRNIMTATDELFREVNLL